MRTLLYFLFLFVPGYAYAWPATVLSVSDGDTVIVAPAGDSSTPISIRLYGIDAPEYGQPDGEKAKQALEALLPLEALTEIIPFDTDKYGRIVALIMYNGHSVNAQMLAQGQAWFYPQYCRARFCNDWRKLEKQARKNKAGLWETPDAIPPWEWRKKE